MKSEITRSYVWDLKVDLMFYKSICFFHYNRWSILSAKTCKYIRNVTSRRTSHIFASMCLQNFQICQKWHRLQLQSVQVGIVRVEHHIGNRALQSN